MFGWNIDDPTKKIPSDDEIARQSPVADSLSFRSMISQRLSLTNTNFSIPSASNECQFRKANESFLKIKNLENLLSRAENLVVLWSITDLYRTEYWSPKRNRYKNIVFSSTAVDDYAKFYINDVFDPKQKTLELAYQIRHWQIIFRHFGIKDYWVDLFNNNDYRGIVDLDRFIFPGSNLMTEMVKALGVDIQDDEHFVNHSDSDTFSQRQKILVEKQLVNAVTCHPTRSGHRFIADLILKEMSRGHQL